MYILFHIYVALEIGKRESWIQASKKSYTYRPSKVFNLKSLTYVLVCDLFYCTLSKELQDRVKRFKPQNKQHKTQPNSWRTR